MSPEGIEMIENVEIKSGGEVVDTIDVEKFLTIQAAIDKFTQTNDNGEVEVDGTEQVLSLVNQQHKANSMNAARAAKTRSTSPINALRSRAKADPEVRAKLNAFLTECGLDELEV
jgi:hypothetical protein